MIKIINSKIITPEGVETKKALLVKDEKILDICPEQHLVADDVEVIDAKGGYVIPGLIDMHCDVLEFKISPRPNVTIPEILALSYYEKKLLSCGITTQFHGVYWGDVLEKHRSLKIAKEMIKKISDYQEKGILNHKIFVRFDIVNCEEAEELLYLINNQTIDLLSFQYHLPGQAQFKDTKIFEDYYTKVRGWTKQELKEFMENLSDFDFKDSSRLNVLTKIAQTAERFRIPLVSHDDDSSEKIHFMKALGGKISEFPISIEAALCARKNNMKVVVGAPNIVQGKSSCGNISARDLIREKAADIICSDYHPPSMLCAAVKLYQEEILSLSEAVNMITLNPAEAAGLNNKGAILPDKDADVVVFRLKDNFPEVIRVLVKGRVIYSYEG